MNTFWWTFLFRTPAWQRNSEDQKWTEA